MCMQGRRICGKAAAGSGHSHPRGGEWASIGERVWGTPAHLCDPVCQDLLRLGSLLALAVLSGLWIVRRGAGWHGECGFCCGVVDGPIAAEDAEDETKTELFRKSD